MDKKTLVNYLKPVFRSLAEDGIKVTFADLIPTRTRGWFQLSLSADWGKLKNHSERTGLIIKKMFEYMPPEARGPLYAITAYDNPEEVVLDYDYYDYRPDDLAKELYQNQNGAVHA
jgi:hypothetical protein